MAPRRNVVLTKPFETKIKLQQDLGMKVILNSEGSFGKAYSMMLRKITPAWEKKPFFWEYTDNYYLIFFKRKWKFWGNVQRNLQSRWIRNSNGWGKSMLKDDKSKRNGINRHAIIYEVHFFHELLFIYYFKLHPISVKTPLVLHILL